MGQFFWVSRDPKALQKEMKKGGLHLNHSFTFYYTFKLVQKLISHQSKTKTKNGYWWPKQDLHAENDPRNL